MLIYALLFFSPLFYSLPLPPPLYSSRRLREVCAREEVDVAWKMSCPMRNAVLRGKGGCKKRPRGRRSRGQRLDGDIHPGEGQARGGHGGSWSHAISFNTRQRREELSNRLRVWLRQMGALAASPIFPIPGIAPLTQPWLSPRPQNHGTALGRNPNNIRFQSS